MTLLLESCYDKRGTNPPTSTKRKQILSERRQRVDSGQLCVPYVCTFCNGSKGSNVAGYDEETDQLAPLYNPRTDAWEEHFVWQGSLLRGQTAIGRATIDVLRINHPDCTSQRRTLIAASLFPP